MAAENPDLKTVFGKALAIESPEDRAEFLDLACGDNSSLRMEVAELLEALEGAGSFMERPAVEIDATMEQDSRAPESGSPAIDKTQTIPPSSVEGPGTIIGPFKLLQELGQGGMGTVYMAEQTEPVRRKVALKIIKPGMDSRQVIARFEAERQALALMDHNNIARVHDAGTTDTGRPYFVMELVKGVPITKYCDENRLTPRERLELFIPVCRAIQHAHQKGIIHRDIKPSNVLVTLYDGRPVPKVIDFGIAKATGQQLTDKTMFTEVGQIVGTMEYMSPEQAEMNQLDIDTRSDVYALGVLLYELLTGSTPITKQQLREVGFTEMLRTIREQEPPKPSTRLSESGDALPSISAVRNTEPAKLSKLVRGELDWIVMKALEKDRARRYETANGFAADIQRHLDNEPVIACPPTAGYRLRKLAQRNKVALATSAIVAAALIVGTVVSIWQASLASWEAVRATQAERRANNSFEKEQKARTQADEARADAEAKREQAVAAEERAKRAKDDAEESARQANDAKEDTRRQLYRSDMVQVTDAFEDGNLDRMSWLLESHLPEPPEEDLRGFEWYHWWRALRLQQAHIGRGGWPARQLAVSPDGKTVAALTAGKYLMRYDAADVRRVGIPLPVSERDALSLSSDGAFLATGSAKEKESDGRIRIWNAVDWRPMETLESDHSPIWSLAFSVSQSLMASGDSAGRIIIWDAATWHQVAQLQAEGGVRCLAFSPDGTNLIVGTRVDESPSESTLVVWDVAAQKIIRRLPGHTHWINKAVFSPDGNLLATGSEDETIRLWDNHLEPVSTLLVRSPVRSLSFSSDSKRIVAGTAKDNQVLVWNVESQPPARIATIKAHYSQVCGVAFVGDSNTVWSAGEDGFIKVWDLTRCEPCDTLPSAPRWGDVAFTADDSTLMFADHLGAVRRWDVAARESLAPVSVGAQYVSIAFSEDGAVLAGVTGDSELHVRNVADGKLLFDQDVTLDETSRLGLTPDGRFVAWTGQGTTVILDWENRTREHIDDPYVDANRRPILSPDGGQIAIQRIYDGRSGSFDTYVYDLTTNPPTRQYAVSGRGPERCGAFSPDGESLAIGSYNHEIRLHDAGSGKLLHTLKGHTEEVICVAFSRNGDRLVSGSTDRTVRIWDPGSGQLLSTLKGHSGEVFSVAFSPPGDSIASSGSDAIKIWLTATHQDVEYYPVGFPALVASSETRPVTWRYTPRSPIEGWQNVDFDDASWSSGPSPFGVGSAANTDWFQKVGDEIWLRKEFELSDAVDSGVFLHALARLGNASEGNTTAEIYLNGELAAVATPLSDYQHLDCAAAAAQTLRPGKNVLAVHCHTPLEWRLIDFGLYSAGQDGFLGVLTKALLTKPNSPTLLTKRAEEYARQGMWQEAAADFSKMLEARSDDLSVLDKMVSRPLVLGSEMQPAIWRYAFSEHKGWQEVAFDDAHWETGPAPFGGDDKPWFEKKCKTEWSNKDSDIWLRKEFDAPQAVDGVFFVRAYVDDAEAEFYLNGVLAAKGAWAGFDYQRRDCHDEAARSLRPGKNVLAVHCKNLIGAGRIDVELYHVSRAGQDALLDVLTYAIDAKPDDPTLHILLTRRAEEYIRRQQWQEATADYLRKAELSPSMAWIWLRVGPLLVEAGDLDQYHRRCSQILERFGQTEDPATAMDVARTCLLFAPLESHLEAAARLARKSLALKPNDPWCQHAQALADYRTGQYHSAIEWCDKILARCNLPKNVYHPGHIQLAGHTYFVQAMAFQRVGQPQQARATLATAIKTSGRPRPTSPMPEWWFPLVARSFRQEAETLINGQPNSTADDANEDK